MRISVFKISSCKRQSKGSFNLLNLADLKDRLNIREDDKDAMLAELITASVAWAETHAGSLTQDTYKQFLEWREFCDYTDLHEKSESFVRRLRVPLKKVPLISVQSFKYYSATGIENTISTDDYEISTDENSIFLDRNYSFPTLRNYSPFEVNYTAGLSSVPSYVKDILVRYCMAYYDEYVADRNIDEDYRVDMAQVKKDENLLQNLRYGKRWL